MAMKKFVRRFSSTSLDMSYGAVSGGNGGSSGGNKLLTPPRGRDRSTSEFYEPPKEIKSSPPQLSLEYLGYTYVEDPRSPREIQSAIKTVKQTSVTHNHWVSVALSSVAITITEATGALLITCPLGCVSQCVSELNRGFSDCIAMSFSGGHHSKQCHVFQARTSKEVRRGRKGEREEEREGEGESGMCVCMCA